MLTDTHVHLDLDEFAADLPEVLRRSQALGGIWPYMLRVQETRLIFLRNCCQTNTVLFIGNINNVETKICFNQTNFSNRIIENEIVEWFYHLSWRKIT